MRYLVYHKKNPSFNTKGIESFVREDYDLVAMVETVSLEKVFELTNHIDQAWWENPEIMICDRNSRSTSVGDVVEPVSGSPMLVEGTGWRILR